MEYDVFISHASEDKADVARPLAAHLQKLGLRVWFDELELTLGDSLRRKIDHGLSKSRYGLVILSPSFFSKEWPNKELDGLVAREDGREKVIFPVWHNLTAADIVKFSPMLADKIAVSTSRGLTHVAERVYEAVRPASLSGENSQTPARRIRNERSPAGESRMAISQNHSKASEYLVRNVFASLGLIAIGGLIWFAPNHNPVEWLTSDSKSPAHGPDSSLPAHIEFTIADAWVRLYDDTGFEDRELTVRYPDDIENMDAARSDDGQLGFGDKASSVKWHIPKGWKVTLYEDHSYNEGKPQKRTFDLRGDGTERENSDLGGFSGDTSSLRWQREEQ